MIVSEAGPSNETGARLRRLLSMLAYLALEKQADVSALARRFGIDEKTVVAELELAACCGLPPYTPDQLLELVVDGDTVYAYGLEALRRPPRLTENEGFALAAAARALLAVPGAEPDGVLATALAKLEDAIGSGELRVELEAPEHFAELRRCAARGEVVELEYLGSSGASTREVETYEVSAREGRFYLDGYCHLADDWRRFALDRIVSVRPLGVTGPVRTPPVRFAGSRAFAGSGSHRIAHVAVSEGAKGLLERVSFGPARTVDGRLVYDVEVADEAWFGKLLLRLGDEAELVESSPFQHARAAAARAALGRYDDGDEEAPAR